MSSEINISIDEFIGVYDKHSHGTYICHAIISEFVGWSNVENLYENWYQILSNAVRDFIHTNLANTKWVLDVDEFDLELGVL